MKTPSKEIVQEGHPVLREIAQPVPASMFGTEELRTLIEDMRQSLDDQLDGVALAGPQIAIPYRIFIVRYDRMLPPREDGTERVADIGVYINPKFVKVSRKKEEMEEGCLSVRGMYGKTDRHAQATVKAYDENGKEFERGGGGILAQAFQHETDHLDGTLFIDHAHDLHRVDHNEEVAHSPFVYFGTPYVAKETLDILERRGITPSLIVSSPDAPQGRGLELTPTPVSVWAKRNNIPLLTPDKITPEVIQTIKEHSFSYAIVVAYGKILPQSLIDLFPKGVLNIHYSLLPKYRGASPVEAALLHGETVTGVTIQKMVFELDAGDILAQEIVGITPTETTRELRARLIDIGANLLADILPSFEKEELQEIPQDKSLVSHSGKIQKEDGRLVLQGDAVLNWNKYRAYAESPGTFFFAEKDGKQVRVKIKEASFENDMFVPTRVTPEGKKEIDYKDFLKNGFVPL